MNKSDMIHASLRSGKGKVRQNNEDAFFFHGAYAEIDAMDNDVSLAKDFPIDEVLFAVCDGMGGAQNGELASYTAVNNIALLVDAFKKQEFPTALQEWTGTINRVVADITHGGGATLALAYVDAQCVRIAHIGDSRVYRLHNGILSQITRDHSKVQLLIDVGMLTPEQARTHPHRHMITRYLGMPEEEGGTCTASIARPMPSVDKDRYLICSDGVTDMLEDARLQELLSHGETADACADTIFRAAINAGGKDNTTLIVFEIEKSSENNTATQISASQTSQSWLDETEEPDGSIHDSHSETAETVEIIQKYRIPDAKSRNITIVTELSGLSESNQDDGTPLRLKTKIMKE